MLYEKGFLGPRVMSPCVGPIPAAAIDTLETLIYFSNFLFETLETLFSINEFSINECCMKRLVSASASFSDLFCLELSSVSSTFSIGWSRSKVLT